MNRRGYLAALGGAATVALSGCTALGEASQEVFGGAPYDVGMSRTVYEPATYETTVGQPVVWKNTSQADHTVTGLETHLPDGAAYFASGEYPDEVAAREAWNDSFGGRIGPRETFEHTFEVPGTYEYVCLPHVSRGMTGTVVVTE